MVGLVRFNPVIRASNMEALMEFLESSTIHGLSYISTAKSNITKAAWFLIVIIGFTTSFYLINESFLDWDESPINTDVSTHPLSSLAFPNVTLCPPKGTNTALNYDLMMAHDDSLSLEERKNLTNKITRIFIEEPFKSYAQKMISDINIDNMEATYQGYHTFPAPKGPYHLEMNMSSEEGRITSPRFEEEYDPHFYEIDRYHHYILEMPENLASVMRNGKLEINLTSKTRPGEKITHLEQNKFQLYTAKKTWTKAE